MFRKLTTTIALALLLVSSHLMAFQDSTPDVTGKWTGYTKFLGGRYLITLELKQEGLHISGEVLSSKFDENSFIKYKVQGVIKGNRVGLKGTELIEKEGKFGCIANLDLQFKVEGENINLQGKWRPNNVKGGCLVGASGPVLVAKVKEEVEAKEIVENTRTTIDKEGEILINGLEQREYYALLIGVNDYDHASVVDLDQPISDAQKLKRVLTAGYTFKEENIIVLENPKREDILNEFGKLSKSLRETDQLLVFYAGHGVWDEDLEQGYWLPSNAAKDSRVNWISNSTIRDYVRSFDSKHTLLISDACFSGGLFKERDAFAYGKAMLEMYKLPSRKAITSGTLTTVPDQSVFMKYLISGLESNTDPVINAEQLFYNLKMAVVNNSPNGQIPQYGVIRETNDEGGAFIFLRK